MAPVKFVYSAILCETSMVTFDIPNASEPAVRPRLGKRVGVFVPAWAREDESFGSAIARE